MNIYQKLLEVRKAVPHIQTDAFNDFHKFKYVSSSAVLMAVRAEMDKQGLMLIPAIKKSEVRPHKTKEGKEWFFTELTMLFTWINTDNPEEEIKCRWYSQGLDDSEKGVGKALTYAEKFFLLKTFNIATDDQDPDKGPKGSYGKKTTKNGQDYDFLGRVSEIKKQIDPDEYEGLKKVFKVEKSSDIGPKAMDQFIEELSKIKNRNERFQAVMAGFNKDVQESGKLDEMNKILEPYGGYGGILTKADQKTIFEKVSKLVGK